MRLAAFIRAEMQMVLSAWDRFAATILPGGQVMHDEDLRDDAEALLARIADDMESVQSDAEQSEKSKGRNVVSEHGIDEMGTSHALHRLRVGMDVGQLVSEYRALRASVLQLWTEHSPTPEPGDR